MRSLSVCKYDRIKILGTGTFGQAWLAVNEATNKTVVIKCISVFKIPQCEIEQALSEVSILGRLRHINIIKYKDSFVAEHNLNIVMEFANCGDLHQKIKNQRDIHFDEQDVMFWFIQVIFALRYIHSKHILHRDLKTQNIFLTSDNVIKLGDFGIAKVLQDTADMAITTIGTPYYMSPEICRHEPYSYKSDMWAAGCILFELCHLRVPFQANSLAQLVLKILTGEFTALPNVYGPIPKDLVAALLRTEPTDRPSADQILCIPNLKLTVDRYITQCRHIIHNRDSQTSVTQLEEDSLVLDKKQHAFDPEKYESTITPPTGNIGSSSNNDNQYLGIRAPKAKRYSQYRCHSSDIQSQTPAPVFSIYKDLLRKRAASAGRRISKSAPISVKSECDIPNVPDYKKIKLADPTHGENDIADDEVFTSAVPSCENSPLVRKPPVLRLHERCKDSQNDTMPSSVSSISCDIKSAPRRDSNSETYVVRKPLTTPLVLSELHNSVQFRNVCKHLYDCYHSPTDMRTDLHSLIGHVGAQIGHDRLNDLLSSLFICNESKTPFQSFWNLLTKDEVVWYPWLYHIFLLKHHSNDLH